MTDETINSAYRNSLAIFRDRPSLQVKFEVPGTWWLPSSPERVIAGNLVFEPKKQIRLELHGLLEIRRLGARGPQPDVVLGTGDKLGAITLEDGFETFVRGSVERTGGSSTLQFNGLWIGSHITSPSQQLWSCAIIEFSGMEDWLELPWLSMSIPWDEVRDSNSQVFGWDPPESVQVNIDSLAAVLRFEFDLDWKSADRNTVAATQASRLRIIPTQSKTATWYLRIAACFRNFLSLAVGESIDWRSFRLIGPDSEPDPHETTLYFSASSQDVPSSAHWSRMLLPYREIKHSLNRLLNAWYDDEQLLRIPRGLHQGISDDPSADWELNFLRVIQALEVFHRRTSIGLYVSENEWRELSEVVESALPAGMPSPLRDSLKARLRYGNEFSLRKRITELLSSLESPTNRLIGWDDQEFCARVIATRNYFTHYDESSRDQILEGDNLLEAVHRIEMLLVVLFLKRLRFSEDFIRRRISQVHRYQALLRTTNVESRPSFA